MDFLIDASTESKSLEYYKMLSNYRLYNNVLDQRDFERDCNLLGIEVGQFKDEILPYNKTYNKIQVLLGEELKRPFDYFTLIVNEEGVREKLAMKDSMIYDYLFGVVEAIETETANAIKQTMQQIPDEQKQTMSEQEVAQMEQQIQQEVQAKVAKKLESMQSPMEVEMALRQGTLHKKEKAGAKLLKYLTLEQDIIDKKNDSFKHGLISGKQIVWTGVRNGEPVVDLINSLNYFGHKSEEVKWFQDGLYGGVKTTMSIPDVISNYGQFLSPKDLKKVEDYGSLFTTDKVEVSKTMKYPNDDIFSIQERTLAKSTEGSYGSSDSLLGDIDVYHLEWKTLRKIYFLSFLNEYGEPQMDLVSEDFPIPTYAEVTNEINDHGIKKKIYYFDNMTAEEAWIEDVWSGVRIGEDIYCAIGRKPYQIRTKDNPYKARLGYHGVNHSAMNAPNISLMDRMKPFQYLYFLVMHKLKSMIAKDKGKIFHFDSTMVDPKIGLEKTLYYLDQLDIDFFNPLMNAEQPGAYQRGKITTATDRSNAQHIINYVNLLAALDEQIGEVAGITKQREGQSSTYEAVTNNQTAIVQSTTITEVYFQVHSKLWEKVLNSLIQTAQWCYKDKGVRKQYILDDGTVHILETTPEDLADVDLGIFITNSRKDAEIFNRLRSIAEFALTHDKASLSDVIKMFKAESIAQLESYVEASESLKNRQIQAQQEREAELEQMKIKSAEEQAALQREHEIEIAMIKAGLDRINQEAQETTDGVNMNPRNIDNPEELTQNQKLLDLKEREMLLKHSQKMAEIKSKEKIAAQKPKPTKK
jgi:hypothetical protein